MLTKLRHISIEGEKFLCSISFDVDDLIGDGIWWLQIYNCNHDLIYDKPIASSMGTADKKKIEEIIKMEFLIYKGMPI